jgi:sulfur-carrier protein
MEVHFFATFREAAGMKKLVFAIPANTSVRQAIGLILEQIPALRVHWLDSNGELYGHVLVFVNGADVNTLPAEMETPLQDTDTLDFFPPVAGGSF